MKLEPRGRISGPLLGKGIGSVSDLFITGSNVLCARFSE
jgi:hypothetical protein